MSKIKEETFKEKREREKPIQTKRWYKEAQKLLEGQIIEKAQWQDWDEHSGTGLVLYLNNNIVLFISQDDEGNGPGAIHWVHTKDQGNSGILPVGVEDYKYYESIK